MEFIRRCRLCHESIRLIGGQALEMNSTQNHAVRCRGLGMGERLRIVARNVVPAETFRQACRDVFMATTMLIDPEPAPKPLPAAFRRRWEAANHG